MLPAFKISITVFCRVGLGLRSFPVVKFLLPLWLHSSLLLMIGHHCAAARRIGFSPSFVLVTIALSAAVNRLKECIIVPVAPGMAGIHIIKPTLKGITVLRIIHARYASYCTPAIGLIIGYIGG
jgi:hypothetical protein